MLFINEAHKNFFLDCIRKTNSANDPYRQALFYMLGLTDDTRRNINKLYNFKERGIIIDGLFDGFQTGTSTKVTRCAFNLYNGFTGDMGAERKDDPEYYSPYHLYATGLMPYFFEAAKLRYPEYCCQTPLGTIVDKVG